MTDYNELDTNNGDSVHDKWVDFDNFENPGNPGVLTQQILTTLLIT